MKQKKALFGLNEGLSIILWIVFVLIVLAGIAYAVYIMTGTQ